MVDADIFFGVSAKGALTTDMLKSMAKDPIVFAMANPDPEITPPEAKAVRGDVIIGTGRSDFNNQVNNVLCFPFLFRGAERIGIDGRLVHEAHEHKIKKDLNMPTHKEAIEIVLDFLTTGEDKVIDSIEEIKAIGHRVVHGGEYFNESVVIDEDVISKIESLIPLAPLHNPAHIVGIKICRELMPNTPNVAVFDTAFHQTMPASNYMYA